MTKKLTRAEKDQIIYNEGHGILHPEYYCYRTKSGHIQIRKRKEPITVPISGNKEQQQPTQQPTPEPTPAQPTPEPRKSNDDYDSVSNKQLLEKMLEILEKNNNTNNNQNLNDPEREKEKEENKQFIENIRSSEHAQLPTQEPKKEEAPEGRSRETRPQREQMEEPSPQQKPIEETRPRPRPQLRGRRFIEPIKRIPDEEPEIMRPVKKIRGRVL